MSKKSWWDSADEDETDKVLDQMSHYFNSPPPQPPANKSSGWGCIVTAVAGGSVIVSTLLNLWYNWA